MVLHLCRPRPATYAFAPAATLSSSAFVSARPTSSRTASARPSLSKPAKQKMNAPRMSTPPTDKSSVCVLGAGIIGLSTSLELSSHGHDVHIVARESIISATEGEPATPYTSVHSGGLWWPFHLEGPPGKVEEWASKTYARWLAEAAAGTPGVTVETGFLLNARSVAPARPWYGDMTQMELVTHADDARVPPRYASALRFQAPIVEADVYLAWLHARLAATPGVTFTLGADLADIPAATRFARERGAGVVVNATGIGAGELCGDEGVVPGRGLLVIGNRTAAQDEFTGYFLTERQEDRFDEDDSGRLDDGTADLVAYAFPRGKDRILIGGSIGKPDDWRREAEDKEVQGLRARVASMVPCLEGIPEALRWSGLRPIRRGGIRLERDEDNSSVLHNYGHGGGGFTTCWGCAVDACAIVEGGMGKDGA